MEIAIFISLVTTWFFSYFFNIFWSNNIFSVIQVYMAKVVGIGKNCIFIFWNFNSYILVSRKNFHVPSFFLVRNNNWNSLFCQWVSLQDFFVWNGCNSWGHRNAGFVKSMFTKSTVTTISTSRVISRCVFHFTGSMWIGKTIRFVFQLIPFLIVLRINNYKVFVVLSTIWIVRVVFCPTKESGPILGQLATNDKTATGLNSLNW